MSGLIDAAGKIKSGIDAKKQAFEVASQLEDKAGFNRAISQRAAAEEQRQAEFIQSRALAVAAASGGGASDPTVVNLIADLEEEGLRKALNQMATGETESRFLDRQAFMKRKEGRDAKTAGILGGLSSAIKYKYG